MVGPIRVKGFVPDDEMLERLHHQAHEVCLSPTR